MSYSFDLFDSFIKNDKIRVFIYVFNRRNSLVEENELINYRIECFLWIAEPVIKIWIIYASIIIYYNEIITPASHHYSSPQIGTH